MKLVLLGTAGYHPSDTRQTTCLMLPEAGVVFDAGTGMYRVREHLATRQLDILLSHAHLDHVVGLTYLLGTMHDRAMERITIHGEAAKLSAIREHVFSELIFPVQPTFELRPLSGPIAVGGGGRATYFPLVHPGGAMGYRVDFGRRSLAYVTDTTARADADYVSAIGGVDLLVHECNFSDAQAVWAEKTGHSHTTAVAEVARQAGVKRLVLVHFNPLDGSADPVGLEVARRIFAQTCLGEDRMEIEF